MILNSLHLLLTYQCTLECEHCFVWGSPRQTGTMTLPQIRQFLLQAREMGTVTSVYFEGGEPFLYYAVLEQAVREARALGFDTGIVTNGFWANSREDALANLRPFAGLVQDLTVSSDRYHWEDSRIAQVIENAAGELGLPLGTITIDQPGEDCATPSSGQIPGGDSPVMYRGRAAVRLAGSAPGLPWESFTTCPHEDLREPGRVHLDPLGNVHLCQGISLGNTGRSPLAEICSGYDPDAHPISGVLLRGGPAGLVREYDLPHAGTYADACHLCYTARSALRERFPAILAPDQVYGLVG